MGFLDKLRKKKKDEPPPEETKKQSAGGEIIIDSEIGGNILSAEDYQRSQNIYNRSLMAVFIFEIQSIPPDGKILPHDLVLGEYIEMTEGLLTLGALVKGDGEAFFARCNKLVISYSKYGESFFTEARIVEAYRPSPDTIPDKYIVQAVLCANPVRHRRKHGRIAIDWNVFFKVEDSGITHIKEDEFDRNHVARTIDFSEGGFKGIVTEPYEQNSIIKCIVETEAGAMSDGDLLGKVIRCYHTAGNAEMYEITVQFITMDDSVREFLGTWIEKMQPERINAEAKITISDDGSEASIELAQPQHNGSDLTYEELSECLKNERVTYGIDFDLLKSLAEEPHYNLKYVIARCTPPQHGSDAVLTYYVDMNPTFTPKVNDDGSADFRDLGLIHKVSKDEVLVAKSPATPGTPGTSVTGNVMEAIPGKDIKFPSGKNTAVSETDTALHAEIDGFVSIVNQKINVLNKYIVEGDVQYSTGNIDHNGIVEVKGDVRIGFSVAAEGDVIIHGSVESATVKAGGATVIHGGCIGEASLIESDGNVAIKFIDGGTVNTRGSLTTSYILGAVINCGNCVEMVDMGLIRNSHVTARTAINAKTVGSARVAADKTIIEVGNDPELLRRHKTATAELAKFSKDLESVRTSIRTLTMMKYRKELPADKVAVLEQIKKSADELAAQRDELIDKLEFYDTQIDELGYGDVSITDVAYEGLKVVIGSCEYVVRDAIKASKFHRSGSDIIVESLAKKSEKSVGFLRSADLN